MNKLSNTYKDIIPSFSYDFLEFLDSIYPDRCPNPSMSDRDIWIKVGQRSVVNYLKSIMDDQHELPKVL